MNATCLYSKPRRTSPALLSGNSRREKFFLDARLWHVEDHLNQGGLLGSDGASLGWTVDAFVDPIVSDLNLYRYVGNSPVDAVDPLGEERIGNKHGGCEIVFHPNGKHPSGVDLHPIGGDFMAHAHVMQDNKLVTRIDKNGIPLPGQQPLTPKTRKLVEKYQEELKKAITTAEKRVTAWKQQQAVARKLGTTGKAGKMIMGLGILLVGEQFAEAAFTNNLDPYIDAAGEAAKQFAAKNDSVNCMAYMKAMHAVFAQAGMPDEVNNVVLVFNIYTVCMSFA